MTSASLSSGYGGLEMALGRTPLWHSEIDIHAKVVLKHWWPEVPNLGDFTTPDFWEHAPRVDEHMGGIPCQGFSAAGRQLGVADPRHLWPFWIRGIRVQRPERIMFENVANLVRGKMRPIFDGIIADLMAEGYSVRWCLLGACAVGAAHHRHRVFLFAWLSDAPSAEQVTVQTCGQAGAVYIPTPQHRDSENGGMRSPGVAQGRLDSGRRNLEDAVATLLPTPSAVSYGSNQGGGAGRTGPVRHSLDALARLDLLPTPAAKDAGSCAPTEFERNSLALRAQVLDFFRSPTARDGGARGQGSVEHMRRRMESGHTINLGDQVAPLPTPRASDSSNGGPNQGIASRDIALSSAVQSERWGKYAEAIARHEGVLGRAAPEPTEIGPKGGRRLAATFSEWLMMLPEGHLTSVLDRNPALARAGNGVVPLQVATAFRLLGLHSH